MIKKIIFIREKCWLESQMESQVRSPSLTEVSYLRLRWCPSSSGSYTPGSPQSTFPRLARSEERNKYHPGTTMVRTWRQANTSYDWDVLHLIVDFNWLYVLPFLNGLSQVHHAERHLHLTDLPTTTIIRFPARLTILPGHAWKICRSQKWQKPASCQRFRYMEAAILIFHILISRN